MYSGPMQMLGGLFFIGTCVLSFLNWLLNGQDEKGKEVVVAQYEAPDGLTPIECAALLKNRINTRDISAELIYLATQGYIKIEKIVRNDTDDYQVSFTKQVEEDARSYTKLIFEGLFIGEAPSVFLSDAADRFYSYVPRIRKEVMNGLVAKGYYRKHPTVQDNIYHFVGEAVAFITIFCSVLGATMLGPETLSTVWYLFLVGTCSAVTIRFFGYYMSYRTFKGSDTKALILGYKEYLQIAEKDRINFANVPEKKPELFEKCLPYAMAFGVEKAWAKEFEGIYTVPPAWYGDSTGRGLEAFNSNTLVRDWVLSSRLSEGHYLQFQDIGSLVKKVVEEGV